MSNPSLPPVWVIVGLSLILFEFAIPGFIIFFFGVGALLVALLQWLVPAPLAWQLISWAALSAALLFGCRRYLPQVFRGASAEKPVDAGEQFAEAGENAVVVEGAPAGAFGKVEFQGSLWQARFETEHAAGDHVTVVRRENLTLFVR